MPKINLHLLLASADNPRDTKSWSGTPNQVLKQLEIHFSKVTVLHYNPPKRSIFNGIIRLLLGYKKYPLWLTRVALTGYSRELEQSISINKPDVVLSISSQGLMYSKFKIPVFLFSDAPWIVWKKAYAKFETLPLLGNRYAMLEARAARSLSGLIFGSSWAAKEAERAYGVETSRIGVVPLGASWFPDCDEALLMQSIHERGQGSIRLLFVGRDWDRKGGPEAVDIVKAINKMGGSVVLEVVGCRPVIPSDAEGLVKVHGPLYRDNPVQKEKLKKLFMSSDFLITPTKAECFGISFAEAQAFGLPPIAYSVHAIPEVVVDDVTGLLFEPLADPTAIAKKILSVYNDRQCYTAMAKAARGRFLTVLNWDAFGRSVSDFIKSRI